MNFFRCCPFRLKCILLQGLVFLFLSKFYLNYLQLLEKKKVKWAMESVKRNGTVQNARRGGPSKVMKRRESKGSTCQTWVVSFRFTSSTSACERGSVGWLLACLLLSRTIQSVRKRFAYLLLHFDFLTLIAVNLFCFSSALLHYMT